MAFPMFNKDFFNARWCCREWSFFLLFSLQKNRVRVDGFGYEEGCIIVFFTDFGLYL